MPASGGLRRTGGHDVWAGSFSQMGDLRLGGYQGLLGFEEGYDQIRDGLPRVGEKFPVVGADPVVVV